MTKSTRMYGTMMAALGIALLRPIATASVVRQPGPRGRIEPAAATPQQPRVISPYGRLPLSFQPNRGQASARVRYIAHGSGYALFLTDEGAELAVSLPRPGSIAAVSLRLVGATPTPTLTPTGELAGKVNYFIGEDRRMWLTGIPTYSGVSYRQEYPGIDLTFRGHDNQVDYAFQLAPGADAGAVRLSIAGARRVSLDARGDLIADLPETAIVQRRPAAYQRFGATRTVVDARYVLLGRGTVGVRLGPYDRTIPVVIESALVYSTYFGERTSDTAFGIAADAAGSAYIVGSTTLIDLPGETRAACESGRNAFVAKLDATGSTLIYATYLGGDSDDLARGIAVDNSGSAYLVGNTISSDFPIVNAIQASNAGSGDAFIAKLAPSGDALVYSTYLGGGGSDIGQGVSLDPSGYVYITGFTRSTNFPTANPVWSVGATTIGGAFLVKLNPAGTAVVYSTRLGGGRRRSDDAGGFNVDAAGIYEP
jgi:hypothetical protein